MLTMLRFYDIEDDGNSVLIIVTDETLVCICGIGTHYSIPLIATLSWFMVWDYNACAWCKRQGCSFLLLLMHHGVRVDHSQGAYLCCFSRLWINLVLNINALPISLKKFLQVLLSANEFLARACTRRSIRDFLLRQLVFLSASVTDPGSSTRSTHMLMMFVIVVLLCFHF